MSSIKLNLVSKCCLCYTCLLLFCSLLSIFYPTCRAHSTLLSIMWCQVTSVRVFQTFVVAIETAPHPELELITITVDLVLPCRNGVVPVMNHAVYGRISSIMYDAETLYMWNMKVHFHGYYVFNKSIPFQLRFLVFMWFTTSIEDYVRTCGPRFWVYIGNRIPRKSDRKCMYSTS